MCPALQSEQRSALAEYIVGHAIVKRAGKTFLCTNQIFHDPLGDGPQGRFGLIGSEQNRKVAP